MECNATHTHNLNKTDEERHREVSERERDTLLLILDFLASLRGFLFLRSLPSLRPSAPPISSHHTLIHHMPSHLSPCLLLLVPSLSLSLSPHSRLAGVLPAHTPSPHAHTHTSVWWRADFAGCGDGEGTGGEREEKIRKRGRCGGSLEEGREGSIWGWASKEKLTFIHSHSFIRADGVCPKREVMKRIHVLTT